MGGFRFLDPRVETANCRCAGTGDRASAGRILLGNIGIPTVELPDLSPAQTAGRVHALGRFSDSAVLESLLRALPPGVRRSLREGFEWYACRGAFFHNDAHYGDVLFGAWCVAGPAREIVFARLGVRATAAPGASVVFDPFEPHAVLDSGRDRYAREGYDSAPASVFIGFELAIDDAVRNAFAIGEPRAGALVLCSSHPVNAETGAAS